MDDAPVSAGVQPSGEYVPPGEERPAAMTFTVTEIASAFGTSLDRVLRAIAGEFGASAADRVDSREAQYLAEVLLGDRPQPDREAALMRLGAYTPRADHEWGIGEAAAGEESDRVAGDDDHVSQHERSER